MTAFSRPLPDVVAPPALRSLPPTVRARHDPVANATLAGREDVTATLAIFIVVLDKPLTTFKPGQYVSLGISDGGQLVQRPYSIVSVRDGGSRVELFVRRLPDGQFSNLLWRQELGARIVVGPVKGLFTLDLDDRRPRVLIGTGTGVAPLLAMLEAADARADRTPTVLLHGGSFADELAYGARITTWLDRGASLDYRATVSRPEAARNSGWTGRTGRVESQLRALLGEWRWLRAGGSAAYLCGNPDMVIGCTDVLRDAGFAPADIHAELFHPPTPQM